MKELAGRAPCCIGALISTDKHNQCACVPVNSRRIFEQDLSEVIVTGNHNLLACVHVNSRRICGQDLSQVIFEGNHD